MNADTPIMQAGNTVELDLATLGGRVIYDCSRFDVGTFQVDKPGSAWAGSAVVEFKVSNDGRTFYSFPSASTKSSDGVSDLLVCSGVRFIAAIVTTASGTSSPDIRNVTFFGKARGLSP